MKRFLLILLFLVACTPQLPNAANVTPVTAIPSPENDILCQIAIQGNNDWSERIAALEEIKQRNSDCGADIEDTLFRAYLAYGNQLILDGNRESALFIYRQALSYHPNDISLQTRVEILETGGSIASVGDECSDGTQADDLVDYEPSELIFAILGENYFEVNNEPYIIYGANYYPRDTPFEHFLTETDIEDIEQEMELIHSSGINTLRIFLRYDDLFACHALVPIAENFERLDTIIQSATTHGFRLIVVLHQDTDIEDLYSNALYLQAQTQFIIERYRDEAAILAWDVRDSGDIDYRERGVDRSEVLAWLAETVILIRRNDTRHAITAGWWQDSISTAPLVDFVSFQYYGSYAGLRQEIANLKAIANRPILLISIGYSSLEPDELTQRNLLFQSFVEVEQNSLLGWMVYTAFDYICEESECSDGEHDSNYYGLWNTSYFPKMAVEAVRVATGIDE